MYRGQGLHNAVSNRDFDLCAVAERSYDFHTSFGKRVAFYQEVPQYRHMEGVGEEQTHVRTVRIFSLPRLSPLSMLQTHPFCLVDLWRGEGCSIRERSGSRRKY